MECDLATQMDRILIDATQWINFPCVIEARFKRLHTISSIRHSGKGKIIGTENR